VAWVLIDALLLLQTEAPDLWNRVFTPVDSELMVAFTYFEIVSLHF